MEYVNLFISNTVVLVSRFVGFVAGALLCVLILAGFYDEKFLFNTHLIDDKVNFLFLVGILGIILGAVRQLVPPDTFVFEPEKCVLGLRFNG